MLRNRKGDYSQNQFVNKLKSAKCPSLENIYLKHIRARHYIYKIWKSKVSKELEIWFIPILLLSKISEIRSGIQTLWKSCNAEIPSCRRVL